MEDQDRLKPKQYCRKKNPKRAPIKEKLHAALINSLSNFKALGIGIRVRKLTASKKSFKGRFVVNLVKIIFIQSDPRCYLGNLERIGSAIHCKSIFPIRP